MSAEWCEGDWSLVMEGSPQSDNITVSPSFYSFYKNCVYPDLYSYPRRASEDGGVMRKCKAIRKIKCNKNFIVKVQNHYLHLVVVMWEVW